MSISTIADVADVPREPSRLTRKLAKFRRHFHAWWEGYYLPPEAPVIARPPSQPAAVEPEKKEWTAPRIKIAEMIWGDGFTFPGGADQVIEMVKPMDLSPKKSLVYVGCGLGGATRALARNFGTWTIGLEASEVLAKAGMESSEKAGLSKKAPIQHFDPDRLEMKPNKFDAACVRHVLSNVANKKRLLAEVEKTLRPQGHLMISDFALSRPDAESAALHAWHGAEDIAPQPTTLEDMVRSVEALKLDLRIADDTTADFRRLVTEGWGNLAALLEGKSLDKDEATNLARELKLWQHRLAAIDSGDLRVVRLYAIKKLTA